MCSGINCFYERHDRAKIARVFFFLRVCLLCDAAMSEDCTWRLWRQEKVERKVWLSSCFVVKVLGVRALAFRVCLQFPGYAVNHSSGTV